MDSYRCKLCGYIYNPKIGDVANGIKPKTAFEDIPTSWRCPRCGAGKDRFVKV
jgi:rubredoxin